MSDDPHIEMPRHLTPKSLCDFSRDLNDISEKDRLIIDCRAPRFCPPTALIFLSKACAQRRRKHSDETLVFKGIGQHDYANNLGFSEALNLKGRPYRQNAFGGRSYIPISQLRKSELTSLESGLDDEFYDGLVSESRKLAEVVSQGCSEALTEALQRAFCEIIRNSFEHGDAQTVGLCAQYWPKLERVEICISDRGIGLRRSLEQGKYNIPESDQEAIYYSLMPGVSSKVWRVKKKKAYQRSSWDNAGYGLFFASQLFGSMGHFMVASGGSALYLDGSRKRDYECCVDGALVSMSIDLSNEDRIAKALTDIVSKASKVKARLGVKSLSIASVNGFLGNSEI